MLSTNQKRAAVAAGALVLAGAVSLAAITIRSLLVGDPNSILISAASSGDVARLSSLLAAGADPNTKTIQGTPILVVASEKGHFDVVQALLSKGADVEARARYGETPLIAAVDAGQLDIIKALIAAKVNVHTGISVASASCPQRTVEIINTLIAAGDIVDATFEGASALIVAARKQCAAAVEALLNASAAVNLRTPDGETALSAAVNHDPRDTKDSSAEIVRMLLHAGANTEIRYTPPGQGAFGNNLTPLLVAIDHGNEVAVGELVSAGANINALDGKVEYMRDDQFPINLATPLIHAAIRFDGLEMAKILLVAGADKNATDHWGHTPLKVAEHFKNTETAKMLRDAGARE